MKYTKRSIAIFVTAAAVLSAASCGSAPAATTTTAAPVTAAADTVPDDTAAQDTKAPADTAAPETTAAVTEAEKVIPEDSEYVIENGITERMKALTHLVDGSRARLAKVFRKAQAGEPITIAYLGGSITQGSSAASPDTAYAGLTTDWFRKTFPDSKITAVNAGIGATGSYIGVYRTDRDVLSASPDLVFIDFSVNDTTEHTDRNIASYDGVIRKIWSADCAPAIVTIAMTMEDGTSFQKYHSEVCKAYGIPMISYHDAILDVIKNGHIKWTDISDDNIHPNSVGHVVLTEMITAWLQDALDNIDTLEKEPESDISTVYASDKYSTAYLVVPNDPANTGSTGWDIKAEDNFGNFGGYWRALSKDGTFTGVEPLKFEVEAKSVGVFFGKMTANGGSFDVVVDGEVAKTINSDFPGGWGNYVEAEEVIDFDECGKHTVEIVPHTGEKAVVMISALALTK